MLEIPVLKNSDGMTKARQILRDDQFREAYVIDSKKCLLGYIDITDALKVTATKSNITVEGYVKEAAAVQPADPIETVVKVMRKYPDRQRCDHQSRPSYPWRGAPVRSLPGHHLTP